jgi:RNA polymerase sigma-70 factor (ECF subfamily)
LDDLGDLVSLVDRARSRDPDAWEALYRRAYPGLVAYASRRLGADRGRDAVAETMARAVAGIDRFEWRGSGFDGWLYGILRHVVVDAQRSQTRGRVERNGTDVSPDPGPLDYVVQGEEAEAVRQAFSALGADDRDVLELRVVAGLSSEDVAAVLGKRPGAVRMAQARALERLRRELRKQG